MVTEPYRMNDLKNLVINSITFESFLKLNRIIKKIIMLDPWI